MTWKRRPLTLLKASNLIVSGPSLISPLNSVVTLNTFLCADHISNKACSVSWAGKVSAAFIMKLKQCGSSYIPIFGHNSLKGQGCM